MIDWQTLATACVLFAAFLYVGRRGWLRIRSLMISKPMQSPACGGCSGLRPACGRQQQYNGIGLEAPIDVVANEVPEKSEDELDPRFF